MGGVSRGGEGEKRAERGIKEKKKGEWSFPFFDYFSTIASTGHTSAQLPQSVHFSSLIV